MKAYFEKDKKIIWRCCQKVLFWYLLTVSCIARGSQANMQPSESSALDSATGNFANAFSRQCQLEQPAAKQYPPEQVQKTSDKALKAQLQHLDMKLSHSYSMHYRQAKQTIVVNSILIVCVLIACGGYFFLIRFRRSFKKLRLEQSRLLEEQMSVAEKINRLSNGYQTLSQKKKLLMATHQGLVASNRSKTELFKAISHDLQIPLIRLQQNLSGLMVTNAGETQFRHDTNELVNMVGSISLLLENLLQWSKFQSQGIHAKPQYTEMTALVNEIVSQQKYSTAEKKISVQNVLKHSLFMYADEEMAKVSLKAILQNIVKLSGPNATITISGKKEDKQEGWLQIDYTGQMPLKQMFLQQYHTDSYGAESSELGKAVSLGWMLCRILMKANHGGLSVKDISTDSFVIILRFPLEESASKIEV